MSDGAPKLTGGDLTIDLGYVLEKADAESKLALAQMIGCDRDVIRAVTDQICEGMTQDGSYAGSDALDEARARILTAGGDAALRELVKNCLWEVESSKDEAKRMNEWAWKIYRLLIAHDEEGHGGHASLYFKMPERPASQALYPSDANVLAWIEAQRKKIPASSEAA